MRMMMRVSLPVETGNAALANGTFGSTLQTLLDEIKPEAVYFVAENGVRTAYFFVNMTDSSQLPAFCEPGFVAFNARIDVTPAMNVDDLKAAAPSLEHALKTYGRAK